MTLQQKLDQLKERMAAENASTCTTALDNVENTFRHGREKDFNAGFTAAAQLLLPLVEALKAIETGRNVNTIADWQGMYQQLQTKAANALSTLERRIEEGGKR